MNNFRIHSDYSVSDCVSLLEEGKFDQYHGCEMFVMRANHPDLASVIAEDDFYHELAGFPIYRGEEEIECACDGTDAPWVVFMDANGSYSYLGDVTRVAMALLPYED